jgi:hypothetical protein
MELVLVSRQRSSTDPKLVLLALRSMAKFRGNATRDNAKVEVEDGEGNARFYFAQCKAFFKTPTTVPMWECVDTTMPKTRIMVLWTTHCCCLV